MVQTPCLKQWKEYVSSFRHDLQPISLAYFSARLGQQYSINVAKGFFSWAAETWHDHPLKVQSACEGTVHAFPARAGEGEQQEAM